MEFRPFNWKVRRKFESHITKWPRSQSLRHRATMDSQVPAPLLPHPGRSQETQGENQLNHPSQVSCSLCLYFKINLRRAHVGGVFSALDIDLTFSIWELQKAKSLLHTEMLSCPFQINFYLIIWTEWNLWCQWKKV